MTGLIGGAVDEAQLDAMATSMYREDWYEVARAPGRDASVGVVEHGTRDADANVVWRGDDLLGVVHGVVSNRDRLSLSWGDVFRGVADPSADVLPRLEGPFALACVEPTEGTVHLATDKAGSRPVYYGADGGFRFASELTPLLEGVANPTLDDRAVGDLLLLGAVVGDRTLVDGLGSLPPATRLVYDGEVSTERYWFPDSAGIAPRGYPDRWLDCYRLALADVTTTAGDLSLWLSGDVESRVAAGVLAQSGYPVETLTRGSSDGGDRESASQVAAYLGVPNGQVDGGADGDLVGAVERAVAATDGMVNWAAVDSLPFVTGGLHDAADVVMDGGRFLGGDAWATELRESDSAALALYERARSLTAGDVRALLAADVDPRASIDRVVDASVDGPTERTALDAARRLRSYTSLRAAAVQRSQVGTRTVAHGPMLDTALRMPARYRVRTLPLTDSAPDSGAPIQRAVVGRLDENLAEIPFARSGVPEAGSARGGTGGESAASGRGDGTYLRQYRTGGELQSFVDDLLLNARDRDALDADAVATLHHALETGELDTFAPIGALTGLELWAQRHLEPASQGAPLANA